MGIIQKQALRNTIIGFFGAGIGAVSRISMPLLISEAQIGLLQLLDTISGVFISIFSLGFDQVLVRVFPKYRNDENGHHGFLLFGLFISFLGIAVSWIIYYFLGDYLFQNNEDSQLMRSFAFLIFPLIFFRIIFVNLDGYARMLFNTIIGSFLESFISKLLLVLSLGAFALTWINFDYLVYLFAFTLCAPGMVIIVFAIIKTNKISLPHKTLTQKSNRKQIYQYMLFGILTGASGSIVLYVDSLMVNKMISMAALGVYTTFFFAARLLIIPSKSINRVSVVVLAESWSSNNQENIQEVYRKSCLNQLLLGVFLFGIGWACLDPALVYLPKYMSGKYVFFFIGIGLLIEMATGVNAAIIGTSEKYKYNTYFNLILTFLVILFNYFLIIQYGMIGAALASMLAMLVINLLRWYFLYKTFKYQPFDKKFVKAFIVSVVFLTICCFMNYTAHPIVKIIVNITTLTILFWSVVIGFKLSEDINKWLLKMKHKIFNHS